MATARTEWENAYRAARISIRQFHRDSGFTARDHWRISTAETPKLHEAALALREAEGDPLRPTTTWR